MNYVYLPLKIYQTMDIKDFIAISGQPGLFKMITQGKSLLIAENLLTGQRIPVHQSAQVSSMEEIAIFTETEDKPLKEVFLEIYQKEEGKTILDPKNLPMTRSGPTSHRFYRPTTKARYMYLI